MEKLYDPVAQHVDVDGVRYCYRQTGGGPAILLLHGLGETSSVFWRELFGDLPRIRVPACVLWGEHDTLVTQEWAERTSAQIPNARLVVIRDAGHTALNEQPAPFLRALSEFLTPA